MTEILSSLSEKIKIWHFALVFVIMAPTSVWLLRQNNLKMVELRDEVIKIDTETGDIEQVGPKITELGEYILNHMNTNMGSPLELPGTYNAAVEEVRKKVEQSGSVNSKVYADAQRVCENPNVLLTVRAQCIQEYVTANAAPGSSPEELEFPDKALYGYSFSSPAWSADIAGMSVLVAGLSLIVTFVLVLSRVVGPLLSRWVDSDPLE